MGIETFHLKVITCLDKYISTNESQGTNKVL